MEKPKPSQDDERYAGPNKLMIALGKAKAYGWISAAIGAAIGGLSATLGLGDHSKHSNKVATFIDELKIFGWDPKIKISDKTAITLGGMLAGGILGNFIGMLVGTAHGLKGGNQGREQFERIRAERNEARRALASTQGELSNAREQVAAYAAEDVKSNTAATPSSQLLTVAGHEGAVEAEPKQAVTTNR